MGPSRAPCGIELNYREFLRGAAYSPPAAFHDSGRDVRASTGTPLAALNTVLLARYPDADAHAAIDDAVRWFRERGVPFGWWVGPASEPADLGARLEGHGFRYLWESPSMIRGLDALPTAAAPAGVEVARVRDETDFRDFMGAFLTAFDAPPEQVPHWERAMRLLDASPSGPFRHYVARRGGRAVATATAFMDGDTVGLYNIGTVPEERGRGLGTHLTVLPMREALDEGARRAVLIASESGEPIYRRLGFEEDGRVRVYAWERDATVR